MILDASLIKSVLTIHDELMQNGLSLVYMGEFNQNITKMFTQMARGNMEEEDGERTFKNRVYHVMVETLQNLNKHSDELTDKNIGKGLFMIGRKGKSYFIITCNQVSKEKMHNLTDAIETVNNATKDELRDMYLHQIRYGTLSEKGGAGLGLIDIARKTNKGYEYQFFPHADEEHFLFLLKVEISPNKLDPIPPQEVNQENVES